MPTTAVTSSPSSGTLWPLDPECKFWLLLKALWAPYGASLFLQLCEIPGMAVRRLGEYWETKMARLSLVRGMRSLYIFSARAMRK